MIEVEIYGEIVPFHTSEIGYCNLTRVKEQLKRAKGQDILVRISSFGGDVDEGFAIYSELRRYAKENKAKINTLAEGRCASIATVIFLAGDKRTVTEHTSPFVHNAWLYMQGDSKEMLRASVDLEKCNDLIAKHYQKHTKLTYKQARELMDNQTSISPEEALQIGFATHIEEVLRPVALENVLKKKVTNLNINMKNKNDSKTKRRSLACNLKKILRISNKIVFDATDTEVDFYELSQDDTINIGDKATISGQPADGDLVMASGDTYVFESGELKEIISGAENSEDLELEEVVEEVAEITENIDDLEARIEELEQEVLPAVVNAIASRKKEIATIKAKQSNVATRISNLSKIETAIGVKDKKTRLSNFEDQNRSAFGNALEKKLNKK